MKDKTNKEPLVEREIANVKVSKPDFVAIGGSDLFPIIQVNREDMLREGMSVGYAMALGNQFLTEVEGSVEALHAELEKMFQTPEAMLEYMWKVAMTIKNGGEK